VQSVKKIVQKKTKQKCSFVFSVLRCFALDNELVVFLLLLLVFWRQSNLKKIVIIFLQYVSVKEKLTVNWILNK
jgi:hypothetical protein